MAQVININVVSETLTKMKQIYDKEKQVITIARKDLGAISTLLDKMKQLPIISGTGTELTVTSSIAAEAKDRELVKLMHEIRNYTSLVEDLTIQINIHDQQLMEKRQRDVEKEAAVNSYNVVRQEMEELTNRFEIGKNVLKGKEEEMIRLANNVKLSMHDINFIKGRLDVRTTLFANYVESNRTTDEALKKITEEFAKHIDDIKMLSNEFILYQKSNDPDPEHLHDLLKKIQEKEDVMKMAAELLKKHEQENTNLQQLFDAVRLHNMTNIFELLIENFQKMVFDMASCRNEIQVSRSDVSALELIINVKNQYLETLLQDIKAQMDNKPLTLTYPTNGSNKELFDYFTEVYSQKKEEQVFQDLVKKIKDRGTEVIQLCRTIINYQERENQKLSVDISAKTDLVKRLQERYVSLHDQVNAHTEIMMLQSELMNNMEENEHLSIMNEYFRSVDAKLTSDLRCAGERINFLETENAELYESNTELVESNSELRARLRRMERYVDFVQRNLNLLHSDEDFYASYDSDDSFPF